MKLPLLGTLFLSDKRKDLLLLLIEKPRNIDEIKDILDVTSSAMMTQIKILIDQGIIFYDNDLYKLSSFGEVIVKKMIPLLNTLRVFADNKEYWENHKMNAIPSHLLERIGELGECELVEPDLNRMYELPKKFTDKLIESKFIMEVSSSFSPEYPYKYVELASKGVRVSLIITEPVFERFKNEYFEQLQAYLGIKSAELFVCNESMGIASSVVTDKFFSFALFYKTGMFHNHVMMSFDEKSLNWGEDLFQHFREMSHEVTGV